MIHVGCLLSDKPHTERTDMEWDERDAKRTQEKSKCFFVYNMNTNCCKMVVIQITVILLDVNKLLNRHIKNTFWATKNISADGFTRDEKVHNWSGTLRSSQS